MIEIGGCLAGIRILVAEDEFLLADDLQAELEAAGAIVLGPVATVADAIALIGAEPRIDGAILDVNLGRCPVYPAAELLAERGVPVVFTSGYDASMIPEPFRRFPLCGKPTNMRSVVQTIAQSLQS